MASLIDRRKLMENISGSMPYIEDGLIFWLDGANIGNNDGYWTDLIGGRFFEIHGGVSHNNKRMHFDGTGYCVQTVAETYPLVNRTFEICAYIQTINPQNWIFSSNGTSGVGGIVAMIQSGLLFNYTTSRHSRVVLPQSTFTFSKRSDTDMLGVVVNLSDNITYTSQDYWGNSDTFAYICKRLGSTNPSFTGDIMSIRMYNRILTQDEVLYNQAADNKRFNLGL